MKTDGSAREGTTTAGERALHPGPRVLDPRTASIGSSATRYEDVVKMERRQTLYLCVGGVTALLVLLFVFYPQGISSIDETNYIGASSYFLRGAVFHRDSQAWFWKPNHDDSQLRRALNSTSPLFSIILIPFVALNWHSAFMLGVAAHALGFVGMVYLLRWRGLSPVWALLYLLYPTFILYSRTVMIDVPTASLVVLMLVLLHRPSPNYFHVGLAMGFMVLLKVSAFPIVMAFFGLMFIQDMWEARRSGMFWERVKESRWLPMALGGFPFAAVLLVSNVVLFNTVLGSAYVGRDSGLFGLKYLWRNLPFYLGSLMVMYPLMLISPIFMKGAHAWEFRISCLTALLFFGSYYFIDQGNNYPEMLIRGLRFMLITMPMFIVAYAEMLTRLAYSESREKVLRIFVVVMVLALLPADTLIAMKHRAYTKKQTQRQEQLSAILPEGVRVVPGSMVAKYVNAAERPDLEVVRLARTRLLPYILSENELPAYLVLPSSQGEGVRTEAYRGMAEREREQALDLAREYYVMEPVHEDIDWMDMWRLTGRLKSPGKSLISP